MKFILLNMSSQFEWDRGIYNRNKHILDELSKRDDVEQILSVDFLPYNLKSFIRLYLKSKIYKKIGKNVVLMGHHYVARRLNDKVISLSAGDLRLVHKAALKLGFKYAFIINFNPLNSDYLKQFKENKKFFDAVDNWINNSIFLKYKKLLEKNYKEIILKSDYNFCVSDKLKDDLEILAYCKNYTDTTKVCINLKNNIKTISNGVDLNHYKNFEFSARIDDLLNQSKGGYEKIIGYMGVISQDRIDSDLLEYIVQNNKNFLFIISGVIHGNFDLKRFDKYNNIKFIGEIRYKEMPYLYSKFDLCIIPHLTNGFIKSMDPKKLYEYLASGKLVVTTEVSGVDKFKNFINIAKTKEDFDFFIKDILKNNNYLSDLKIKEMQSAVLDCDWKNKVDEMIKLMV